MVRPRRHRQKLRSPFPAVTVRAAGGGRPDGVRFHGEGSDLDVHRFETRFHAERLQGELSGILNWIEQLNALDVEGVEPLVGVGHAALRMRRDEVTDGNKAEAVLGDAPERAGPYFWVPKVVECWPRPS